MIPRNSLKHLFVSKTRLKLLQTIFYLPDQIYYVRELTRVIGEEINSVRRELKNLKSAGLLSSEWRSNRLYYRANPQSEIFTELLLLVHKSTGFGQKLLKNKQKLGQIKYLIYSGRFLRNSPVSAGQPLDFLLVGKVVLPELGNLVREEEKVRGREINYSIVTRKDFFLRLRGRDPFIVDLLLNDRFFIIGNSARLANDRQKESD